MSEMSAIDRIRRKKIKVGKKWETVTTDLIDIIKHPIQSISILFKYIQHLPK